MNDLWISFSSVASGYFPILFVWLSKIEMMVLDSIIIDIIVLRMGFLISSIMKPFNL